MFADVMLADIPFANDSLNYSDRSYLCSQFLDSEINTTVGRKVSFFFFY